MKVNKYHMWWRVQFYSESEVISRDITGMFVIDF